MFSGYVAILTGISDHGYVAILTGIPNQLLTLFLIIYLLLFRLCNNCNRKVLIIF